jgi:hypothetical protein
MTLNQPNDREPRQNFFWPNVATEKGAKYALSGAFWVCIVMAVLTALYAVLAIAGEQSSLTAHFNGWAFVDVALWAVIAAGLKRLSPTASWGALILYVLEIYWRATNGGLGNNVISYAWTAVFLLAFVHGVRGTQALHRLRSAPPPEADKLAA